jgi:nucleoid-associated protein YgaU
MRRHASCIGKAYYRSGDPYWEGIPMTMGTHDINGRRFPMGLFDFIKDLGQKDKNADDAKTQQELSGLVNKAGIAVQNFQLKYEKGLATISGVTNTQKDLELVRLIVGNHRAVEKVNDDGLRVASYAPGQSVPQTPLVLAPNQAQAGATASQGVAPAAQAAEEPGMMVTVKKGDTLSKIALEYLGNANLYHQIFEANRPMLKDPDEIFPGQVLRIPSDLKPKGQTMAQGHMSTPPSSSQPRPQV